MSGIRGIVGESLTPSVVVEFARAYGTLLEGGRVVLGRDSRVSGEMFACAAAAGLTAAGCEVTQLGIAMTPTVAHAICTGHYDGGIVITASHNPGQWNGMKVLDERGLAPDPSRAERLAAIRDQGEYRDVRDSFAPLQIDDQAGERHVEAVRAAVECDLRPLDGMRVVLDSVNGAGGIDSGAFLTSFGCDLVQINDEPTGLFAHGPEPIAENLTQLCDAVRSARAAVGFVQDPDADRLAVVDENGVFIGEEYTLALAVHSVLSRRPGPIAANLSTSRMIDDIAGDFGMRVFRTPVGEAHVARAVLEHECVLGGEGNGGVIDPRISPVRDSLSAMSHILQLMAATGKSISALVAEMPRYTMIKQKFDCPRAKIETALRAVAAARSDIGGPDGRINDADGLRIDTPKGWVHIRASNTEPIVRIMAEAADASECEALIGRVRTAAGM
ncbi:MAG: phosphoglucosamine mutase [Planctomycetes bacterium]|nr:phosphoglucosamine mutase [Planctomycetota bacterium]